MIEIKTCPVCDGIIQPWINREGNITREGFGCVKCNVRFYTHADCLWMGEKDYDKAWFVRHAKLLAFM